MSGLTDFNDLHQAKGKAAVRKTIEKARPAVAGNVVTPDIWPDPILPGGRQTPTIDASILPGVFAEYADAVQSQQRLRQPLNLLYY